MKRQQSVCANAGDLSELNADEAAALFDRLVRREMGITADEFLSRYDAGEYENVDLDDVPGLVDVWMALPLVR